MNARDGASRWDRRLFRTRRTSIDQKRSEVDDDINSEIGARSRTTRRPCSRSSLGCAGCAGTRGNTVRKQELRHVGKSRNVWEQPARVCRLVLLKIHAVGWIRSQSLRATEWKLHVALLNGAARLLVLRDVRVVSQLGPLWSEQHHDKPRLLAAALSQDE